MTFIWTVGFENKLKLYFSLRIEHKMEKDAGRTLHVKKNLRPVIYISIGDSKEFFRDIKQETISTDDCTFDTPLVQDSIREVHAKEDDIVKVKLEQDIRSDSGKF